MSEAKKKPGSHDIFDDALEGVVEQAPLPRPGRKSTSPVTSAMSGSNREASDANPIALTQRTEEQKESSRASLAVFGNKGTALDRLKSGETAQVVEKQVDPGLVDVWKGNPRYQNNLSAEKMEPLIESIKVQGQLIPGVARRKGDRYELIYGSRRLAAVNHLKANGYPDIRFRLEIRDITDEAAFRLADEENRNREDVSAVERAKNYAAAIKLHYNGKQTTLVEKLGLSKSLVSKLMKISTIPDEVIAVFPDLTALSYRQAYELAEMLDEPQAKEHALTASEAISREIDDGASYDTTQVLKRLQRPKDAQPATQRYKVMSEAGKPMVEIKGATKGGVTLKILSNSGALEDEIVSSIKSIMRNHGMTK